MRIDGNINQELWISGSFPKMELLGESEEKAEESKFQQLFSVVMSASDENSRALSAESREMTAELLMGELDDLPAMQVAGEKSNIAFELNLNIRNKVLDAYSEVMKMGV